MEACPTHRLVGIIGDKWSTMVLADLADGPRRYAELDAARERYDSGTPAPWGPREGVRP